MSVAVDALRAERDLVLGICAGLSDADWKADSGCPGWSVQDVISHLGALYWLVADRSRLADSGDLGAEAAGDFQVRHRRNLSAAAVAADYAEASEAALAVLDTFDGQHDEIPLGDLGTYQLTTLPAAFGFDHYLHIRADLHAPRGPLAGPVPSAGEPLLALVADWMEAALPQQNADLLASSGAALELAAEGAGARLITVGAGDVRARAAGPVSVLARCASGRASWDDPAVTLDGDPAALAVLRQLRIF